MTTGTLDQTQPKPVAPKRSGGRGRTIAAVLVFAVACLITTPALLGHWAHRTIIDSGRYLDTVGPLAASPQVQDAIANVVTKAVTEKIDTQSLVSDALGSILGGLGQATGGDGSKGEAAGSLLAGPIAAAVNGAIDNVVHDFVASPQFQSLWLRVMAAAQTSMIALLEGKDEGIIQTSGDTIVLDVVTVIDGVKQALVDRGITVVENIDITPKQTQIVLAEVPGLTQVQTVYQAANPLLALMPLLVALLFGLAILFGRRRSRWVIATGVALGLEVFVCSWALGVGQGQFVNAFAGTLLEPAADVFWETLLAYLIEGMRSLFLLALLVIAAGWFSGASRPARALRQPLMRGLHQVGRDVGSLPGRDFVAAKVTALRVVATVIVVAWFALGNVMDVWTVIWSALLLALLFTLIEIWRGSALNEVEVIVVEVVEV